MIRNLLLVLAFTASAALASGALYEVKVDKIEKKGPGWTLSVAYPQLANVPEALAKSFNPKAKADAEAAAYAFIAQAMEVRKEAPQMAGELSLTSEVETKHVSPRLIVLLESGYEFLGGAHGNPFFSTVAVDALDGRDLEIQDMFRPGAEWLPVVSKSAVASLEKRSKELDTTSQWIREGAGPEVQNFQVFWPGEDGLHFQFSNYAVAPYSSGAPEVVVPYSSLQGMLNDRYFD